jgi:hypothetical protein
MAWPTQKTLSRSLFTGCCVVKALCLIMSMSLSSSRWSLLLSYLIMTKCEYGVWHLPAKKMNKLWLLKWTFMMKSAGVSRMDKVKKIKIFNIIWAEDKPHITDTKENKLLYWYGHVQQMTHTRLLKSLVNWVPMEGRNKGWPKTSWYKGKRLRPLFPLSNFSSNYYSVMTIYIVSMFLTN